MGPARCMTGLSSATSPFKARAVRFGYYTKTYLTVRVQNKWVCAIPRPRRITQAIARSYSFGQRAVPRSGPRLHLTQRSPPRPALPAEDLLPSSPDRPSARSRPELRGQPQEATGLWFQPGWPIPYLQPPNTLLMFAYSAYGFVDWSTGDQAAVRWQHLCPQSRIESRHEEEQGGDGTAGCFAGRDRTALRRAAESRACPPQPRPRLALPCA